MGVVERSDRFQFNYDDILNQQIDYILPDDNVVVVDLDTILVGDGETILSP